MPHCGAGREAVATVGVRVPAPKWSRSHPRQAPLSHPGPGKSSHPVHCPSSVLLPPPNPPLFCFSFCPFHSLCWQGRFRAVLTVQVNLLAENVSLFLLSPFLHVCSVLHRIPPHVPCGSRRAFRCCEEPRLGRHYRAGEKSEHLQEASPGQRRLPRRRTLTCPVCLQLASAGPGYRFLIACKIMTSI